MYVESSYPWRGSARDGRGNEREVKGKWDEDSKNKFMSVGRSIVM